MTRSEINKQFALLKERIATLETKVSVLESSPTASDLAASWRARLQKMNSLWRILAVDINRPSCFADGRVHVHRVISSDPHHFMVLRRGEDRGVIRKKETIERWILKLEGEYEDKAA